MAHLNQHIMRKLLLLASALLTGTAHAQLATFESQTLIKPDTFFVNYSNPLNDAGFDDGNIHFPYVWDTAWGGAWSSGFAFSNMKDSVTSGYTNMYSAKTAGGYNGSEKYAVYWAGYGPSKAISLVSKKRFIPQGFFITNSTYTYNSMRDGDFVSKKFGGVSGNDSDWYKLTVNAYLNGALKTNRVTFYLADFRYPSANDFMIKDWTYCALVALGEVDSLSFSLNSSDTGAFGMNTPAYFCLDNFSVSLAPATGVEVSRTMTAAKVYPNPTTDRLQVELLDATIKQANIFDMSGRLIAQQSVSGSHLTFNTDAFMKGVYILKLEGANGVAALRFVKQ